MAFNTPGTYAVDYRATDKVNNTSAPKTISFRILSGAGCTSARSDEFDGTTIGSQWLRHTRNGGTPTTGVLAPTIGNGVLHHADERLRARRGVGDDGASARSTSSARISPSLGDNWTAETRVHRAVHRRLAACGSNHCVGDNNFFRSTITHSLSDDSIYVEQSQGQSKHHRGGARPGGLQKHDPAAERDSQPVTIRMGYTRTSGANTVVASVPR